MSPAEATGVLDAVAEEFGIAREEIRGSSHKPLYVEARQVAVCVLQDCGGLSWSRIAAVIGRSDHTTAWHAYRTLQRKMIEKPELAETVARVKLRRKRVDAKVSELLSAGERAEVLARVGEWLLENRSAA